MEASRTGRLKVDGWSNTRFGRIEEGLVAFEVMWWGCACPTCLARLDAVMNRLKDSDVKWKVRNLPVPEREGGKPSAILMVEPTEMPERVDSYFSDLLGLRISEVA